MQQKDELTLPAFLDAKNRPKPPKIIKAEDKWKMPEARESRSYRRQKKAEHDKMVLTLVESGCDTFQKIRKELNNDAEALTSNEISNALRRNIKSYRIRKDGRRYYSTRNR